MNMKIVVLLAGMISAQCVNASEASGPAYKTMQSQFENARSEAIVQLLFNLYDEYKEDFPRYVSAEFPVFMCEGVLTRKRYAIYNELAALSYKDVIFSSAGAQQAGLLLMGYFGPQAVNWTLSQLRDAYFPSSYQAIMKSGELDVFYDIVVPMRGYANTGLRAVGAIAGFGLFKDIKAMRDKKNKLSQEYDKCIKMLEILERA